jgi:5-methylcytosine-specific restriction endonuclease McrA
MTANNARKVTGLDIRDLGAGTWAAFNEGNQKLAEATHRKPSIALTLLVNKVYAIRCAEVDERDGGKCVYCGSRRMLSHHHKIHRSKGRDDRTTNIETVCQACHDKQHQKKRSILL